MTSIKLYLKEYGFFAYINLKIVYKWKNFISRKTSNEDLYYLYNGHADVTMLVNKAGDIKATYYYDAFGEVLESTGNVENSIRYAGYKYDEETGLYYLNARMLDFAE